MNCKDFRQNLFLYFSNELSDNEFGEFEFHKDFCPECNNIFSEYENISERYTEIPQYTLTDFQKEGISSNVKCLTNEGYVLRYAKFVIAGAAILLVAITAHINLINRDKFDAMAVFETEKIGPKITIESVELLPNFKEENSLFENLNGQINRLESTSFNISFSFEDNPQLDKIKQRINEIKKDNFFRSES